VKVGIVHEASRASKDEQANLHLLLTPKGSDLPFE